LLRKTEGAEFLDYAAKIFILTVIFQSIAAKSCSRALFRHVAQNRPTNAPPVDDASAKKSNHFAIASVACQLQSFDPVAQPEHS
jgi:hypothetical protein